MNGTTHRIIYADFWIRFVAALIDITIVNISYSLIFAIIGKVFVNPTLLDISVVLVPWLYFATMESSPKQATIGKGLVGLIVTDLSGNRISFIKATARNFTKILSFLTLLIGFFMAGFTKKKQALHDLMADCLVIEKVRGYANLVADSEISHESQQDIDNDAETKPAYDLSSNLEYDSPAPNNGLD